jgi:hypothetical protein
MLQCFAYDGQQRVLVGKSHEVVLVAGYNFQRPDDCDFASNACDLLSYWLAGSARSSVAGCGRILCCYCWLDFFHPSLVSQL